MSVSLMHTINDSLRKLFAAIVAKEIASSSTVINSQRKCEPMP